MCEVPKGAGALKFEDPRLAHQMAAPPRRADAPSAYAPSSACRRKAGDLVLFESWLRHEVPPARFSGERISISFNYAWQPRHAVAEGPIDAPLLASSCSCSLPPAAARADQETADLRRPLHYSHDAWTVVPPKDVIEILKKAGIKRAMVSSSNNEGTKMLQDVAPGMIVPELRPYRSRGELVTWAQGSDGDPVPRGPAVEAQVRGDRRVPHLRRRCRPAQHARASSSSPSSTGCSCIRIPMPTPSTRHFQQDPNAKVLWAHSGFERPEKVREMLRKYPNLWCDLAFLTVACLERQGGAGLARGLPRVSRPLRGRHRHLHAGALHYMLEHARWSRQWLSDLPPRRRARRSRYENGERLFGGPPQ